MMVDRMIPEVPVVISDGRMSVEVRMPWYRALPLSSVTKVGVKFDGVAVPTDDITFCVNDTEYALDALPELWQEWWYVLDSVWLRFPTPAGVGPGSHDVNVHLGLYIPYLPMGPFILCVEEDSTKRLEVVAA